MDADEALSLLGRYSRWQLENYLALAIGFSLPFAWMMMSVVFIENATLNESIPFEIKDGELVYEKCVMYANFSEDNTTIPCQYGYWYDPASGYESTITTEDLVCGKETVDDHEAVGTMVCALFNRLADIYGRKRMFLIFLYSNVVIAWAQAFSPGIIVYIVLSFLDGIQQQGTVSASYGLLVELFPAAQRTFAGNAVEFFFAFGYMSLVAIAYFVRNWRYLLLSITLPLLGTISFYWVTSESIPWLVANGRPREAEKILRKAAKRNKTTLPENIFSQTDNKTPSQSDTEEAQTTHFGACEKDECVQHVQKECNIRTEDNTQTEMVPSNMAQKYRILDIFRSKTLTVYSLVQFSIWFTVPLAYSAVSLTVTYLPGDRYLNTFLYAVTEIPAYIHDIMAWVLCAKVGRRLSLVVCNILAGFIFLTTLLQLIDASFDMEPLLITLNIIGKAMVTCSFAIMIVGLGLCQFFARVAGFIAPFSRTLTRHYPALPPVIIGVMSITVGFLARLLPETRHRKLPDTIQEIEQWKRRDSKPTESVQS